MTALVPLRNMKRQVIAFAQVDEIDSDLAEMRWHIDSVGYPARFHQRMHSLIAERMGILGIGPVTDHINNDKLDNRRANLRPASRSLNQRNPANKLRSDNKSGVRGVYWVEQRKRWVVQGNRGFGSKHVGYFVDLEDAKAARLAWEAETAVQLEDIR